LIARGALFSDHARSEPGSSPGDNRITGDSGGYAELIVYSLPTRFGSDIHWPRLIDGGSIDCSSGVSRNGPNRILEHALIRNGRARRPIKLPVQILTGANLLQ
jgi:hypothetical protein